MKQSQKLLLTWLIEDTRLFDSIKGWITEDDFTEPLYRKAAQELFTQYGESGQVNPAKIISRFQEEEEQKEIAGLFNARIHEVETKQDKEKALKVKNNCVQEVNYENARAVGNHDLVTFVHAYGLCL